MHRQYANLIASKVDFFRQQHGWTQDDLVAKLQARGVPITRCVIANIETGRSAVTDKQLQSLAELFVVDVSAFFPPKRLCNGQFIGLIQPIPTRRRSKHRRPRGRNRLPAKAQYS